MGWREADTGNEVLRRIVMLLVALASLAERAAWLSAYRRRAVLGILMPAEAKTWALLVEMMTGAIAFDANLPADEPAFPSAPARDAAHLASRLRTLALWLIMLFLTAAGLAGAKVLRGGDPVVHTAQRDALAPPDTS